MPLLHIGFAPTRPRWLRRLGPLTVAALLASCDDCGSPTSTEIDADNLKNFQLFTVAGNDQTAAPGSMLTPVVRLTDDVFYPGRGAAIQWTVTSGGGTVTIVNAVTDSQGYSTARWTLGSQPGPQTLKAVALTGGIGSSVSTNPKHSVSFTATAVVSAAVSSITVAPDTTLLVGGTAAVRFTLRDAAGQTLGGRSVNIFSSNSTIARVDFAPGGATVTGVAQGTADVIVQSEGKEGRAQIVVVAPSCPGTGVCTVTISTNNNSTSVQAGHTLLFQAILRDLAGSQITSGPTVTYSTTNAAVARVEASAPGGPPGYFANIVGVSAGTATITATANGRSGSVLITVTP